MRRCSVAGCEGAHLAKGYCSKHYQKFSTYGDPLAIGSRKKAKLPEKCSVEGCAEPRRTIGLCNKHWSKHRRKFGSGKKCSVDACNKMAYAKELCSVHYHNLLRCGNPIRKIKCLANGCDAMLLVISGKKYCEYHSRRLNKTLPMDAGQAELMRESNNPNWNNGSFMYKNHADMKRIRTEIISERGNKCEKCGADDKRLIIHHIDLSKDNHTKNNFLLVCQKCHVRIHIDCGTQYGPKKKIS